MHEHQDAVGNVTGYTIVTTESAWDETTRERIQRLVEWEKSLCPCGCGVPVEQAWDKFYEPWSVEDYTCYARRALERVRRAWEESHKNDVPGWADGVEHFVVPHEDAAHNEEAEQKASAKVAAREGG